MQYRIVTDSSCDLPSEYWNSKYLTIVPFYVSFDSEHYNKEIVELPVRKLYDQMVNQSNIYPKTSMPSITDFVDAFTPIVRAGEAVICICITSKFSGSLQSATNARALVLEDYPDAQITVIDSTVNTVLQGIYVLEALKMKEAGVSYEDTILELERIKSSGRIFFTVGSLDYLQHGGRIGKVASLAGSLLNIKPLITLKEGEIFSSGVSRGRKKSLERVLEMLTTYITEMGNDIHSFSLCIGYGYDFIEAQKFQERALSILQSKGYELSEDDLPLYQIGATIAAHTGPYPIGFGIVYKNNYTK